MTDTPLDDEPGAALRAAMMAARGADPQQAADAQRRAREVGAPAGALQDVPRDQWPTPPGEFDVDAFIRDYPRSSQFLSNPDNARVAGDAEGRQSLIEMETAIRRSTPDNIARGIGARALNLLGSFGRTAATVGEEPNAFIRRQYQRLGIPLYHPVLEDGRLRFERSETPEQVEGLAARALIEGAEGATFGYTPGTSWEDVKARPFQSVIPFALETGLVSTPDMVAAVAALPFYVAARTGEIGQARTENDLRQDATVEDLLAALPVATAASLLERIGARGLIGLDDAVRGGFRGVPGAALRAGAREALTEAAQEGLEYTGSTVGTETGFNLADAAESALIGAVAGGPFGASVRGVTAPVEVAVRQHRDRAQAAIDADAIQELNDAAANSVLRQRSPETFEQFIAEATEGGPVSDVYIDAQVLAQSGVNIDELRQSVPAIDQQLDQALSTGGDVRIPVEQFAARIAGTDASAALLDHLRINPALPSRAEVAALGDEANARLAAEAEQVLAAATTDDAFRQSAARVEQSILDELQTAGRFTRDVNSAYASLVGNFYTVNAKRLGITPEQMAERYPLQIRAELPQGQRGTVMDQQPGTVRLTHFSRETGIAMSDPSRWGSNSATPAEERARVGDGVAPPRTYFYDLESRGGRPEAAIAARSPFTYETEIAADRLYDFDNDPEGLRAEGMTPSAYEAAIREAGYAGYRSDAVVPGAVAVFDPVPLRQTGAIRSWEDFHALGRRMLDLQAAERMERVRASTTDEMIVSRPLDDFREQAMAELFPETAADTARYAPLDGAPKRVKTADGYVKVEPFKPARDAAYAYMESRGLRYEPPTAYAKVDAGRAKRLADSFDRMAHAPDDPLVRAAYSAMIEETLAQYQFVKATGLEIEFIGEGQADPYAASPRMAIQDVIENNHLWVFPTDAGFGGTASADVDISGNPLLAPVDEWIGDRQLLANDVFRIVHDYFGHIKDGNGFRADGEENAWQSHAAMYTPLARRAMTTETRGQNSWVNYGPFAEFNRTANAAETQYAPQKIGLLPSWADSEGFLGGENSGVPENQTLDQGPVDTNSAAFKAWFGGSKVVDENGDPLVVYHGTPFGEIAVFDERELIGPRGVSGFFFSASREVASTFERRADLDPDEARSPTTMAVYLSIQNPARLDREVFDDMTIGEFFEGVGLSREDVPAALVDRIDEPNRMWLIYKHEPEVFQALREHGFDGFTAMEHGAPVWVAFRPEQIKSATGNRGTFDPADANIYNQSEVRPHPAFYSALTRAVAKSPLTKAPAAQWKATLAKTPGVKKDEIEWSGINEWLEIAQTVDGEPLTDAKGNIPREAVLAFLENGGVQVEERVLGSVTLDPGSPYNIASVEDALRGALSRDDAILLLENDGRAYAQLMRMNDDLKDDEGEPLEGWAEIVVDSVWAEESGGTDGRAQFGQYKLPGADETYREILLTLPNIDGPSTHWDEPNVVAHARITTRIDAQGRKVLFLEEVQSDWHQMGRDEGYATPASAEQINAAEDAYADADDALRASWTPLIEAAIAVLERRAALYTDAPQVATATLDQIEDIRARNRRTPASAAIYAYNVLNSAQDTATPQEMALLANYQAARLRMAEARQALRNAQGEGIPDAPFRSSWPQLVMKRMISYAVENGHEAVAWINGNQQNGGQTGGDGSFFYERNLVNATNDVIKKLGGRVEPIDMRGQREIAEAEERRTAGAETRRELLDEAIQSGDEAEIAEAQGRLDRYLAAIDRPNDRLGIQNGFTITDKMREQAADGFALFQQNRGQIAFGQDMTLTPTVITLLRTADLSTFLHETGHFFLEVTRDMASRPDAPAEITQDMDTLLGWFGIEGDGPRDAAILNVGMAVTDGTSLTEAEVAEALAAAGLTGEISYAQSDTERTAIVRLSAEPTPEQVDALAQTLRQEAIALRRRDGSGFLAGPNAEAWGEFNPEFFFTAEGQRASDLRSAMDVWNALSPEEKRPHHETFARGFEAYLFEGRAPTPALRTLFQRFRSWLVNVYKSIARLNVDLTDDVRGVMDRMVAVSDEIAATEAQRGFAPLAEKPPYMSEEAWADYQRAFTEATEQGVDTLTTRAVRDMKWASNARSKALKRLQAEAREQRRQVKAEVTAEVMAEPVNRVRSYLRRGVDENGEPIPGAGKLDLDILRQMYGDAEDAPWRALRAGGKFGEAGYNGLHPDVVADLFGYESGDALVRDLATAEDANQKIAGLTDQRMLERYGDIADEAALERAADEAVANDAHTRAIATDYAALAQATGQPRALASAARTHAASIVNRIELKRLKPGQFFAAMTRAGKAADAAAKRGDLVEAATQRRNQLINLQAAKYAIEAKAEVDKGLTRFQRIIAGKDEALARSRDMALVNAARAILSAYGLGRVRNDPVSYLERVKAYDPQLYADIRPFVEGARGGAKPIHELTFEQFQGLRDTVLQLWTLSRRVRQIEIDGQLVDINLARAALSERLDELGTPVVVGATQAPTDQQKFARMLQGARASLRRVEHWVRSIDSADTGAFRKFIWQPVSTAADRYRIDQAIYLRKFLDLVRPIESTLTKAKIAAPELGYTFTGKAELLHAILHSGNQSNLSKLLLGRRWGKQNQDGSLDTARWDAFTARLQREGTLTKADYDFVQGVWDLLEETKPGAQRAHRAMYGRYFSEVTADPVQTPWGEYRGGYVPATTDAFMVQDAQLRSEQEALEDSNAFMFPAASNGFTKARVEDYTRELSLDIRLLPMHIDKVLRFTHLGPPVRDVARILKGREFSAKLAAFDPVAQTDLLLPWLQRSARQVVQEPMKGWGGKLVDGFFREMRTRTGMQFMFANLSNTMQQLTGFSNAALRVGKRRLASSLWRYARNPKGTAEAVTGLSQYMATRTSSQVFEMRQTIEQLLLNPSKYEKLRDFSSRHAYFTQFAFQNVVDVTVWSAAYEQAVERGDDDLAAIRFADSVVREGQQSMAPEDVSRFETGTAFTRMFTQFYSYFNNQANMLGTEFQTTARTIGVRKGAGRLLYIYTFGFMIPAVVAETIAQMMRGGFEDEEGDGYLDDFLKFFFGSQLSFTLAAVPVVGQTANAAIGGFTPAAYDDRVSTSPAISIIESGARLPATVYKAIVEGEGLTRRDVRDLMNMLGLITGTPLGAVGRPVSYAYGVANDEIAPTGPVDAARGLATGAPSPESRTN